MKHLKRFLLLNQIKGCAERNFKIGRGYLSEYNRKKKPYEKRSFFCVTFLIFLSNRWPNSVHANLCVIFYTVLDMEVWLRYITYSISLFLSFNSDSWIFRIVQPKLWLHPNSDSTQTSTPPKLWLHQNSDSTSDFNPTLQPWLECCSGMTDIKLPLYALILCCDLNHETHAQSVTVSRVCQLLFISKKDLECKLFGKIHDNI